MDEPVDYVGLIEKKRYGSELEPAEVRALVEGFMAGAMTDYQMSAWLMAAVLQGLTLAETIALADAEVDSGERIDLSSLGRPVLDKHSTGGVGDKVTLVLAPLVASCGALFGKMSGRGLGHTGGTIDKLESIPGFRTEISAAEYRAQLAETGICVAGQSGNMVPADKRMYALRDVTGTIDSNPLVAASIMSKKIASGSSTVVMDIKVGGGAFLKNRGQAAGVFHLMREIGAARGVEVRGLMTPMEQPLGRAVGNSVEVIEAVEALRGAGPEDLEAVVVALAAEALSAADLGLARDAAAARARQGIADGSALDSFREWIETQGGDAAFIDDPERLPQAAMRLPVRAAASGYVGAIDALAVGRAMVALGAGRRKKEDSIDPAVGLLIKRRTGDAVGQGELLAEVLANDARLGENAVKRVAAAFEIAARPPGTGFRIESLLE